MQQIKNEKPEPTTFARKVRKLKNKPLLFVKDSKAAKSLLLTKAKLGSFALVVLAFIALVVYYTAIASDRFESKAIIMVKQAGIADAQTPALSLLGLPNQNQDINIVLEHILSIQTLLYLDNKIELKAHYSNKQSDLLSRLASNASQEDFFEYYLDHVDVALDTTGSMLVIKAQGFDAQFTQLIVNEIIDEAETFINNVGQDMANEQLSYVEQEVNKAHQNLIAKQQDLISFQELNQMYSPEVAGGSVVGIVNSLEANISASKVELKKLQSFLNENSNDIVTLKNNIKAMQSQLLAEQEKLVNQDAQTINNLAGDYKQLELSIELAADLYKSSLLSLEVLRAEAFHKLKHLVVIAKPAVAQEAAYPRRLYNIVTYLIATLLIYGIIRVVVAAIKEHK